jgi:hypothetical protein
MPLAAIPDTEVLLQIFFHDERTVKGLIEASSVGFASSIVVL